MVKNEKKKRSTGEAKKKCKRCKEVGEIGQQFCTSVGLLLAEYSKPILERKVDRGS